MKKRTTGNLAMATTSPVNEAVRENITKEEQARRQEALAASTCKPNPVMCEAIIANATKSDGGVLYASVPLELMDLDRSYQRTLKPHHKNIAREWDESLCGVLIVSYRDGRFYIVDGQHRFEAAKEKGIARLYCLIHTDWTQEIEAMKFAGQDENKSRLSWPQKISAKMIGNDPTALSIKVVCEKYGVEYNPVLNGQVGSLTAMYKAARIVDQFGEDMLDDIFYLIHELGWHMEKNAYSGWVLYAVRDILANNKKSRKVVTRRIVGHCDGRSLQAIMEIAQRDYPRKTRTESLVKLFESFYAT